MEQPLLSRFETYIKQHSLADSGDKILLAVSGGVDSMVMMALFAASRYANLGVAHCNFQLRGEESYEDEKLVEQASAKLGIPFYNMRFDTEGEMARTGESVQIAARRLRYQWFAQLSAQEGYTAVAIAHHADDSIETFFINLFRGTGLKGLTGISKTNGRVIRPLLFASRREIMDYAHAHGIEFREDSSNRSTKYLRNKIRLGLVPRIKEFNPHFTAVMGRNIQRLTDAQMFINAAMEKIRQLVEEKRDGLTVIHAGLIGEEYPENYVIFELLNNYGFKGDVVDSLCQTLGDGVSGKRFYSRDYVAYTDRGNIIVAPISEGDSCSVPVERSMHKAFAGNSGYYFVLLDIDSVESLDVPDNVALLDADKLQFPLELRRWNEGDWFVPLGMTGRKKVSDFLIDTKVSIAEKNRQFVLLSGEDIVWLTGRRIDDRYKITSSTENVLKIVKEVL